MTMTTTSLSPTITVFTLPASLQLGAAFNTGPITVNEPYATFTPTYTCYSDVICNIVIGNYICSHDCVF